MAKKQAQLSPEEQARFDAAEIVRLEGLKKDIDEQIEILKSKLKLVFNQTGQADFGVLVIERRNGKPKINFGAMTPKQKGFALEQLMSELPEFVEQERSLNVEKMYYALGTSPAVVNALKVRGLEIVQEETLAFKKVAEPVSAN